MRIKPSSANSKKPLLTDKPVPPKKPTIVKCFICNQMFYSQDTFDSHMDQHQKRVNKNLPDEIQRKTMQSFGLKRKQSMSKNSTTLQAINQNQLKDKKFLNKTMKLPLTPLESFQNPIVTKFSQTKSSMLKKPALKSNQFATSKQQKRETSESPSNFFEIGADKQISQIDQAIKESTLLMSQMASITERYDKGDQFFMTQEVHSDHEEQGEQLEDDDEKIEKTVSQYEFVNGLKSNNWSLSRIEQEILKTKFSIHQSLQNCQIQIEYLRKVSKYSSDPKSLESMTKTKSKILAQVVSIIMSEDSASRYSHNPNKIQQRQTKQEENLTARTCSQCLDMIGFGQICTIQGDQSFHKVCFSEKKISY